MQKIFSKKSFPAAPGGDRYEWEAAKTSFDVGSAGLHVIAITASSKNAQQNGTKDDDDLRVVLDGFAFGKYEQHEEKISWKGFGTSSSWDGASLKGGTKTVYFFVELEKGSHTLQFFADNGPVIKEIIVSRLEDNEFELHELQPDENIKNSTKGIPWMSFVFLGANAKTIGLSVRTKSGKAKNGSDGDNLKVIVNGEILKNKKALTSSKYKNYYFSGDLNEFGELVIDNDTSSKFLAFENAIELWYDEEPEIQKLKIVFFEIKEFLEGLDLSDLRKYLPDRISLAKLYFRFTRRHYSLRFLNHSSNTSPTPIVFRANHPIVRLIKNDPMYEKILRKLCERINDGVLAGQIWPTDFGAQTDGFINFNSFDLGTALHGIRKIEYEASPKGDGSFVAALALYDIYDFAEHFAPAPLAGLKKFLQETTVNDLFLREKLNLIHGFEIQINLRDTVYADY